MTKQAVQEMSVEQLEAALAAKKKEQNEDKARKRLKYEDDRSELIDHLGGRAANLFDMLRILKFDAMTRLTEFREVMLEYGDLRRGEANKGNFEIKNDHYKITFTSQVVKRFDERALVAEQHISKFLISFVKKRDKDTFHIISELLQRNEETGEFDINLINRLYKMEERFDDENWRKGLQLFRESYAPTETVQYVRFARMQPTGGWEAIVLDFAKLKIVSYEVDAAA